MSEAKRIIAIDPGEAVERLEMLGFSDGRAALKNLLLVSGGPLGQGLDEVLHLSSLAPSPDSALNNLETILKAQDPAEAEEFLKDRENLPRLITIAGSSQLLTNILVKNPSYFGWLFNRGGLRERRDPGSFSEGLKGMAPRPEDHESAGRALRLFRNREFLRIGLRDLAGLSGLEETARELSDLASASLGFALEVSLRALKKEFGEPISTGEDGKKEATFTVLGLGKLGGRELNFSSDIDIIYIYSSDRGETEGGGREGSRISLHDFFVRLSTSVTRLISGVTGEGTVFRVDLDLRPEGKSGDMANSLRSMEIYYESWGRPWERAAMIKARPVAGDMALGEEFLRMIRPFVFRRYLDFTSIEEIKGMKEKINLSLLRKNPDEVDVKLGQGGIREIEFFCQALQLIHGGKDPEIREKGTLKTLDALLSKGYIGEKEAGPLKEGYVFLRNLEHRIQIVEGRQTQAIPAHPAELERLARMMGFKDTAGKRAGDFFWDEYRKRTEAVHEVFRSLFYRSAGEAGERAPKDVLMLLGADITGEEAEEGLKRLGFKDSASALKDLNLFKSGPAARVGQKAAALLDRLRPLLLNGAAKAPDPDRALHHLERFITALGGRTAFYSLLAENRAVLDELMKIFGSSEFLSRDLIERPESLDLLLSKELSVPYKQKDALIEEFFKEALDREKDFEERLSAIRNLRNQEVFRIGINDIRGALKPRQVTVQMSLVAEVSLETAYRIALEGLKGTYGAPEEDAPFSIIGMGKLGARELIYGSDLDIIFVYRDLPVNGEEDGSQGKTSGPRSISNHEFFVKLGQRIISVLTVRTKEGVVFNVDTRLRPSGSSGPLVVSRTAFLNYHRGKTSIWERQALTRARAVAADLPFAHSVLQEIEEILYSRPLSREDVSEMLRIRARMEAEIAREDSTRRNIKTGKGGLVDIEFLIQALQLSRGASKRALRTPFTEKALKRLFKEGILTKDDHGALKDAYNFLRLLEMRLRIVEDRPEGYLYEDPVKLSPLAKRAGYTGENGPERLLNDYKKITDKVRSIYHKTLEALP